MKTGKLLFFYSYVRGQIRQIKIPQSNRLPGIWQGFIGSSRTSCSRTTPNQQNIRIQATRAGRKGKTVTLISGFKNKQENLISLLKQLKAQCGTGGTLKENEIEIQGDHKQKILEILLKLGYKAKISGG